MRISSPPIQWPCYYGIDTPTRKELIGSSHTVEEICRYLGADSLGYLSLDGMLKVDRLRPGSLLPRLLHRSLPRRHRRRADAPAPLVPVGGGLRYGLPHPPTPGVRLDLPGGRRRHRGRRRGGAPHRAARRRHPSTRGSRWHRRVRLVRAGARRLHRAGPGLLHRRRRHQAQGRLRGRPPRHGRHRPGGHERQRRPRARRRAAVLPRLHRHSPGGSGPGGAAGRGSGRGAVVRLAAPSSAARPPSFPASTPPASTIWPASPWASSSARGSSTAPP